MPRRRPAGAGTGWTSGPAAGTAKDGHEVSLDRLLVLAPEEIRREGAALDRSMFDAVVAAARELHALPD